MNKEVNFEIAKLLKKRGFESMSEPRSYYCVKDLGEYYWQKMGGLIVGWEHLDETCSPNHGVPNDYIISAPTIAEVVMWLYEKHGIWIAVNRVVIGSDEWDYDYIISYLPKEYEFEKRRSKHLVEIQSFKEGVGSYHGAWYTPTEAYEAAIKHVLENLL